MVGRSIGFYNISKEIGQGKHGVVYRAVDLKQDRDTMFVALKVFHRPIVNQAAKQQFIQSISRVLQAEPKGICPVFAFETSEDGQQMISTGLLESASLAATIEEGSLNISTAIAITLNIIQALANLHKTDTYHHNLKPSNIFFKHKKEIVLTDFGIGNLFPVSQKTSTEKRDESIAYLSPEQLHNAAANQQADIWAVGVLFYRMIAGKLPFPGENNAEMYHAIVEKNPVSIDDFTGDAALVQKIFRKTLAKNPLNRYNNMHECFQDFKRLAESSNTEHLETATIDIETLEELPIENMPEKIVQQIPSQPEKPVESVTTPSTAADDITLGLLPFQDEDPPSGHENFATGLLIELFGRLKRVNEIQLAPMAATMSPPNRRDQLVQMGQRLGVTYLLTGNIRREATAFTVTARLFDVSIAGVVWEKNYSEPNANIYFSQESVALLISRDLSTRILSRKLVKAETPVIVHQKISEEITDKPVEIPVVAALSGNNQAVEESLENGSIEKQSEPVINNHPPQKIDLPGGKKIKNFITPKTTTNRDLPKESVVQNTSDSEITDQANHHVPPVDKPENDFSEAVPEITAAPQNGESAKENSKITGKAQKAFETGEKCLLHWTVEDLRAAKKHFQQALQHDPDFAPAHAGLSKIYTILGMYSAYAPKAVMPRALQHAYLALEKDPTLPAGLLCLGTTLAAYERDWKNARLCYQKAIQHDPGDVTAYHWYANNYLIPNGEFTKAHDMLQKAAAIDPQNAVLDASIALQHFYAGEYPACIEKCQNIKSYAPDFPVVNFILARAYLQTAQFSKSMIHFRHALNVFNKNMNVLAIFANAAAQMGRKDIALNMLKQLQTFARRQYVSSYDIALICVALADHNAAFGWLNKAVKERAYSLIYLNVDPLLDPLRADERFAEIQ